MEVCSICHKQFNTGYTLSTGSICICCVADLPRAKLPEDDRLILEQAETRGIAFGGRSELSSSVASRLVKDMVLYILVFFVTEIVFYVILLFVSLISSDLFGSGGFITTFFIGSVLILILGLVFHLRWLATINEALEGSGATRILAKIVVSFFIPLYGIYLTLLLRRRLLRTPNENLTYGRLDVV